MFVSIILYSVPLFLLGEMNDISMYIMIIISNEVKQTNKNKKREIKTRKKLTIQSV